MNIKALIKYELYEIRKSLVIYYGIIIGLLILITISFRMNWNGNGNVNASGIEAASIIFIFIMGLNSFKKYFEFFQANGISRRAQHLGFIINVWIVASFMALIDNINALIFSQYIPYQSLYYEGYGAKVYTVAKVLNVSYYLGSFLWAIFVYAMAFTIGYSITLLYYRMNRNWKIIVSIGVPALFYGVPIIDSLINKSKISNWVAVIVEKALGVANNGHNSYMAVLSTGLVTVILTLVNHAMIRRTVLK